VKGSQEKSVDPFRAAVILSVKKTEGGQAKVKVRLLVRPEEVNTANNDGSALYWSDQIRFAVASHIQGRCHLLLKSLVPGNLNGWLFGGDQRFYLAGEWNNGVVSNNVPEAAVHLLAWQTPEVGAAPSLPKGQLPLRCLDIFAGAGGLTEGLRQSGLCRSTFAIECDEAAAAAFRQNHPDCVVLAEDW